MGVPVVTFPGRTFAGRHSTSYLSTAGLTDFIAADLEGYIDLALNWASRQEELAALRRALRGRLQPSPLCDAKRFAEDWLSLLVRAYDMRTAREK
jgi:predicted O-linked N-acetylglucosamine transferase (SPINDLY family)